MRGDSHFGTCLCSFSFDLVSTDEMTNVAVEIQSTNENKVSAAKP